jgi:large-conductance mechanosensitive channel
MFTFIIVALAVAYVVLKVINTRARFAEEDAKREEAERQMMAEAEELAEEEMMRAEAVDVEAEEIETSVTED